MSTYRAYQVTGQRRFELVERELHEPSAGDVRFAVLNTTETAVPNNGDSRRDAARGPGLRVEPSPNRHG